MAYTQIFLLKKKLQILKLLIIFSKNTCDLDTVLTRIVQF